MRRGAAEIAYERPQLSTHACRKEKGASQVEKREKKTISIVPIGREGGSHNVAAERSTRREWLREEKRGHASRARDSSR